MAMYREDFSDMTEDDLTAMSVESVGGPRDGHVDLVRVGRKAPKFLADSGGRYELTWPQDGIPPEYVFQPIS